MPHDGLLERAAQPLHLQHAQTSHGPIRGNRQIQRCSPQPFGPISTDLPALEYLAPGTGAADCLFRNPATCVNVNLTAFLPPFLFWDVMHPTTQVHGVIGNAMLNALKKQP